MTRLPPYPRYRPAGDRWLDQVPDAWRVTRARYLCDIGTGSGDTVDAVPGGGYPFIVRSASVLESDTFDHDCEAILTAGDGGVGEVFHHVSGKFLAHQRVYVLQNFREVLPRYFYYYFSSFFGLMALDGSARTTVDSVRRWMIADMPIAVPPIADQESIVAYLDRETARLDQLIDKQRRLITTLGERRTAVTDSCLRDPGAARVTTIRRVLTRAARAAAPDLDVITAYRDGTVTLRRNRREDGYTMSESENGYQEVRPGDLVFHALDGFAGAVGISDSRGNATPVYHVCNVATDDDPEYLALLLRYLGTSGFLTTQAPNVRQRSVDFRNWTTFGRVPITLPPVAEQKRITALIQEQAEKTEQLLERATRLVATMQERRAALVVDVVTGCVDVREEAS